MYDTHLFHCFVFPLCVHSEKNKIKKQKHKLSLCEHCTLPTNIALLTSYELGNLISIDFPAGLQ